MQENLVELCQESIQALKLLRLEKLISEEDLEKHLKEKLLFVQKLNETLSR